MSQDIGNLALQHDDRRTWVPFGTDRLEVFVNRDIEHFFVKGNNCIEGLPLGGGGYLLLNRQMGEALWDSLMDEESEIESPQWHRDILEERKRKI